MGSNGNYLPSARLAERELSPQVDALLLKYGADRLLQMVQTKYSAQEAERKGVAALAALAPADLAPAPGSAAALFPPAAVAPAAVVPADAGTVEVEVATPGPLGMALASDSAEGQPRVKTVELGIGRIALHRRPSASYQIH